jgi:uncharacterized coiled-coil DUF342 family protein
MGDTMPENTETTTVETAAPKMSDVVRQYKEYVAERTSRRDAIKAQIATLAAELKAINEELDADKEAANEIRSMMVRSRKSRDSKAPAELDPATGEPKAKRGPGRPKGSGKAKD